MQRVRFGATGFQVAPFGFGTLTLGDPLDEAASHRLLDHVVDTGINLIDTANTYNGGLSETVIGNWLANRGGRDRVVLASKIRYAVGDDAETAGLSPRVLVRELEASLRRLRTDHLDLLFLHQPDDDTPLEVTLRCLDDQVRAGRLRAFGLSNFAAWQATEAVQLCRASGWARPLALEPIYNLIARDIETEVLPMAAHFDFGISSFNPLAGGLLAGRHHDGDAPEAQSTLERNRVYRRRYWHPRQREAAARLADIARDAGRTPVELALRFILDNPGIHVALLGATRVEQIDDCVRALDAPPLGDEERVACDRVWKDLSGPIPGYCRTNANVRTPGG